MNRIWLARRAHTGATPDLPSLPDAAAADWGWSAQQAYAVGLDQRLRAIESDVSRNASGSLLLAAAVGILGGLMAAAGVLALRGRR